MENKVLIIIKEKISNSLGHEEGSIGCASKKFLRRLNSRRLSAFGEWLWRSQCADVDQFHLFQ